MLMSISAASGPDGDERGDVELFCFHHEQTAVAKYRVHGRAQIVSQACDCGTLRLNWIRRRRSVFWRNVGSSAGAAPTL
jgi:hypothetical protein